MWIILTVLKWIGIFLLAGLGLCLFFAGLVIFVPVRYEVRADSRVKMAYSFKFSWLCSVLSLKKKADSEVIRLYLFGIPIRRLAGGKEKREHPVPEGKPADTDHHTAETDTGASHTEGNKANTVKKIKPVRKKNRKRKRKREKKHFSFRKVSSIIGFVKQNGKILRRLFSEIKELICYLSPTKVKGDVVFGTGDPALTGLILGGVSLFPAAYQKGVRIVPDFEKKRFEAEGYIKGRIRLLYFLRLLFRLYRDSGLKRMWKQFNKVKKEAA